MSPLRLIDDREHPPADRPFGIEFRPAGLRVVVDPSRPAHPESGLRGSLLAAALTFAPEAELAHECGGLGSCGTCRVRVIQGAASCNARTELEVQVLELEGLADDARARLACQCVPKGSVDLIVEIPSRRSANGD